jgi:prepilin-type N-terminal cleavage/methylation domain-containing protein
MKKTINFNKYMGMAVSADSGFSLVEVLVAAVIISVSSVAVVGAFNLVTQSVTGTGLRADQSRRIDAQIDQISEISEIYTACNEPAGEIPVNPQTACGANISPRSSFYYFPDYGVPADVEAFFAACRSTDPSSHITSNFINQINILPSPGGGIAAPVASRIASTNPSSHLVQVTWSGDPGGRLLRQIQIRPVVSSWCP